ncbi:hypothetical protein lbkm_2251 [Lachnospiraceae bacterium KM106-2]|nr:hypothetical protein lbkm_2251 [Lachnospiraceae bacterium KM106-2]
MQTITLCGSMRFENEMQRIAFELESKHGYNVLQCIYGLKKDELTASDINILEATQLKRIELSNAIYVVDIEGYIGDMTKKEIQYAREKGKDIILHSEYTL